MISTFESLKRRGPRAISTTLIALATACNTQSCDQATDPARDPCDATDVMVQPQAATMPVLASTTLTASVGIKDRNNIFNLLPESCSLDSPAIVGWRSTNEAVAVVSNTAAQAATIVAVSPGTANIVATVGGPAAFSHPSTTVPVTVVALVPTVRLSASTLTLTVTQTNTVRATVVDQDNRDVTARATVTWQSANEAVATVDRTSGAITGVSRGATTITATAVVAGATASAALPVAVSDPPTSPVASLTLSGPTTVRSGDVIPIKAKALDASGNTVVDPAMSWQSSDPTKGIVVRQVTDPLSADVTGKLVGTVTVTATASSGKTASIDVQVTPGPVATVVVTGAPLTLRAGKTVTLTATAKDLAGNKLTDQPIAWSSTQTTLATVDASGLVTTIQGGSLTIRATATGTSVFGSADLTVLAKRVAYAVADQPQTASYAASATSSFNSAGGTITITRQGPGAYQVTFPGQQALDGEVETFAITGYGSANGYCKIASWANDTGSNLVADVRCFAFGGAPGDSPFTISLLSDGALGNRFGFALADQPTAATPYTPTRSFNASSSQPAPPVRIARLGVGTYTVTFTGNSSSVLDPEGVIVTAYGTGNERCQAGNTFNELTATITVNCWTGAAVPANAESVPADSRFTIVVSDRGRGFGQQAGFAYVDDAVVVQNGGSMILPTFNGYNTTTGPVSVVHRGNGFFDVTFAGLGNSPAGGRFIAHVTHVENDDSAYCSVSRWTIVGADLVVSVTCWHEEDGEPEDGEFYLFVIQ